MCITTDASGNAYAAGSTGLITASSGDAVVVRVSKTCERRRLKPWRGAAAGLSRCCVACRPCLLCLAGLRLPSNCVALHDAGPPKSASNSLPILQAMSPPSSTPASTTRLAQEPPNPRSEHASAQRACTDNPAMCMQHHPRQRLTLPTPCPRVPVHLTPEHTAASTPSRHYRDLPPRLQDRHGLRLRKQPHLRRRRQHWRRRPSHRPLPAGWRLRLHADPSIRGLPELPVCEWREGWLRA
jgi:hypothetical protein